MIGEDWQLVTYELVEFENKPVEVQDCSTIANPLEEFMEYTLI